MTYDELISEISSKSISELKSWKTLFSRVSSKIKIKILIICLPCNGFGDIIFATKLNKILKDWYNCEVNIITTQKKGFVSLGEDPKNIYDLEGKGNSQCKRLKTLTAKYNGKKINLPKFDLYFVAPLQSDLDPNIKDVKSLIPEATKFNTYFFSEYNDYLDKKIDVNTGIGNKRLGLLFTEPKYANISRFGLKKYAVIYTASEGYDLTGALGKCELNFCKLLFSKYKDDEFELVIQKDRLSEDAEDDIIKLAKKNYKTIKIVEKDFIEKIKGSGKRKLLTIRYDIFPLTNPEMLSLISKSVKDILLTGDQSITDALSCCSDKNIYYQTMDWKKSFAKNLAIELPNKWIAKLSTACGSLQSINYKSNYKKFVEKWDFRKLAKKVIDGFVAFSQVCKKYPEFLENYERALKTQSKRSFIERINN